MARRFDKAIRALNNEKMRIVGKVASSYLEKNVWIDLAFKTSEVKNINEAIIILEAHKRNKAV